MTLRVAIIHYWLFHMRGGEKVLEALCEMFPQADIFTHVLDREKLSPVIQKHRIETTFISRMPMARKLYQKYLPFMPRALEELDLNAYDLVISSEAGPAKGVIARPDALHICYTHSPMRYLWDQYHIYFQRAGGFTKLVMPHLVHELRKWDVTSAARVDAFAANSNHVAKRIRKYWRRESTVVFPPVAVDSFGPVPASERAPFFLWAGELVSYKRPDLAVEAFNRLGLPFVVIGDGPERKPLEAIARPNITFLGKVPFDVLKSHYARCQALVFPGEEDFGIIPVEVMASGRPVIAYERGGALDTVVPGVSGQFFQDASVDGLIDAIEQFTRTAGDFDPQAAMTHARQFAPERFKDGMRALIAANGVDIGG